MALTTDGRNSVIARINGTELPSGALFQFIGWGTGTTAENVTDTDLAAQAAEARTTGTLSAPVATTSRCVGTITSLSGQSIAEVGRFNIATKGGANQHLLQRHVFSAIPLLTNDAISFTLDLLD